MEIIAVLLLVVVIFLLINNRNVLSAKMDRLDWELKELREQARIQKPASPPVSPVQEKASQPPQRAPEKADHSPAQAPETDPKKTIPLPPPKPFTKPERAIGTPVIAPPGVNINTPETRRKSFFEKHPDLEKFIGENLVNKIGIAVLVLGIAYFVKYAIDNEWIGPVGRVGIGVLCGGILIGIAHRTRNSYHAFSSVLVGGGIAVLYFTITLAFQEFRLFSQAITFALLVVITIFAVALSLLYNRQELGIIALLGGLASPFMVSTGHSNFHALFIYLILLNAGLLVVSYFKAWRLLNTAAFALTAIVSAAACVSSKPENYRVIFSYLSVLYLQFFGINVANTLKEGKKFIAADFSILLLNSGLFFGAGIFLLDENLRGAFSASLAALNLVLSFLVFRTRKADLNILYLLIGITLTFVSLTAPLQLQGHHITLFWSAEAVLLYWLWMKSELVIIRHTSSLVWLIMLVSLLIDWWAHYFAIHGNLTPAIHPVLVNRGFVTGIVSASASLLIALLRHRDPTEGREKRVQTALVFSAVFLVLLFSAGLLEVNQQFYARYPGTRLHALYSQLYMPAFIILVTLLSGKSGKLGIGPKITTTAMAVCLVTVLISAPLYPQLLREMLLTHTIDPGHFTAHWIADAVVILLFYKLARRLPAPGSTRYAATAGWLVCAAAVTFFSLEFNLFSLVVFHTPGINDFGHITSVYGKTGLPVLWGISSFGIMWLGMKHKWRYLRIFSLTLFSVTLLKLFIFDIRNIPPAGKIAAFFCLGILLLIISFMYQRVKKIISDDEKSTIEP